jgi:hypothetical protein
MTPPNLLDILYLSFYIIQISKHSKQTLSLLLVANT